MIDNIRLQNFRSYKDDSFEFDRGVNIIIGANASGKTNLLEAILILASGTPFRTRDAELVKFNKSWARLDGQFGKHKRTLKLVLQGSALQREFVLDDKQFKRLSLDKTLPVVLFEPDHLQLLIRGPEQRRVYFDNLLERTLPGFKTTSAKYRRALSQRNALLKQNQTRAEQQLFVWNIRLSELGAEIVESRRALLEALNKKISRIYSRIAGSRTKLELSYDSPILQGSALQDGNYSSSLLSHLEKSTKRDLALGFTVYGPHRDDVLVTINNQPAAASASRGEMRSVILTLKIAELDLLESARDLKPLLLLDDVFSELDGARRRHLVEHLKNHQTLITTTDADAVIEYFSKGHKLISL